MTPALAQDLGITAIDEATFDAVKIDKDEFNALKSQMEGALKAERVQSDHIGNKAE